MHHHLYPDGTPIRVNAATSMHTQQRHRMQRSTTKSLAQRRGPPLWWNTPRFRSSSRADHRAVVVFVDITERASGRAAIDALA